MSENGTPIGQYDIIVTPGLGRATTAAPAAAAVAMPRTMGLGPEAAREVQLAIHRTVPGSRTVTAQAAGGRLILRGAVPNAMASQQIEAIARGIIGDEASILDTMTVLGSIQVNVRVRIAEIDRTITRQLGFNWQALGAGGNWRFGVLTGAATGIASAVPAFGALPAGALSTTTSPLNSLGIAPFSGAASGPFQLGAGYTSGTRDINGVIDALAADQLVTILAEPNLTAQSGETASFLAGGEFPIPVGQQNGQMTVEFKNYGVSLAFVPTVMSDGRINLHVNPEVSQLTTVGAVQISAGNSSISIPALTVRRADTTVELGSGQSFAIAGLLQKTSTDAASGVPGVGDMPVLGSLFRSDAFQRNESELVIVITPYIVRPVNDPSELALPTDGVTPAGDFDRILRLRQIASSNPAVPSRIPGQAGFIVQ